MDLYWYVAYWVTLCTQTRCCSSEMAKVPPNSSDVNHAPTSSHLQPRAPNTAPPPAPESHLLGPSCQLRLSSGCTGETRLCLCPWQEWHRFGTVTQPLSQATGYLKLGVGRAAINPQKYPQDLGELPGPCLQGRGDKLTVLLVHINTAPPVSR